MNTIRTIVGVLVVLTAVAAVSFLLGIKYEANQPKTLEEIDVIIQKSIAHEEKQVAQLEKTLRNKTDFGKRAKEILRKHLEP
ncbi:MAG: hypothetical protein Q7R92_01720 [bacterium]|nr:hypothetical protein [bacterium]